MDTAFLPPALLHILEGLPRDFPWNALDHPSAAKCLVAWQQVCCPKKEGCLGIRCLFKQNRSLQVKLLHHRHSDSALPWSRWLWGMSACPIVPMKRLSVPAVHRKRLVELTPFYRDISAVCIGDSHHTLFWLDTWLAVGVIKPRATHCSPIPWTQGPACSLYFRLALPGLRSPASRLSPLGSAPSLRTFPARTWTTQGLWCAAQKLKAAHHLQMQPRLWLLELRWQAAPT